MRSLLVAALLAAFIPPAIAQTCSSFPLLNCEFAGRTKFDGSPAQVDINSAHFGILNARCDGKTNDQAAFQTAINTAEAAGGGAVLVPVTPTGCYIGGQLSIAASNITLAGQSPRALLIFPGGAGNDIVAGDGTNVYSHVWLKNLEITHAAAKTADNAVVLQDLYESGVENVEITGFFGGIFVTNTNNIVARDIVLDAPSSGSPYGLEWWSPTDGAHRSDVLALEDFTINMHYAGPGIVWDGMTQTLRLHHVGVIQSTYGMMVRNTAESPSYYPAFLQANDLEIDGASVEGLRIEGGVEMSISNSDIDCNNNACTRPLDILPDLSGSITRGINISSSRFHLAPHEAALINAKAVYVGGGTRFFDSNQSAGLGGNGAFAALEIGANASQVVIADSCACERFGDFAFPKWGVQVDAGANAIALVGNDYRTAWSGSVNNLAGDGAAFVLGGIAYDGTAMGPVVDYTTTTGTKQLSVINQGTASTSAASVHVATGSTNAYGSLTQTDGTTPTLSLVAGPGDPGGLVLGASNGAPVQINAGTPLVVGGETPASSTAPCPFGQVTWDANYVYVCVGTNNWRRSALSPF